MKTACARADEVLAGAPLDNGNVDPRQRQLTRQHQPRRATSDDHHRMLGHRHTPVGITPTPAGSSANSSSGGANTRISAPSAPRVPLSVRRSRATHMSTTTPTFRDSHFRFWLRPAIMRHDPGLAASPPVRYTLEEERSGYLRPRPSPQPPPAQLRPPLKPAKTLTHDITMLVATAPFHALDKLRPLLGNWARHPYEFSPGITARAPSIRSVSPRRESTQRTQRR